MFSPPTKPLTRFSPPSYSNNRLAPLSTTAGGIADTLVDDSDPPVHEDADADLSSSTLSSASFTSDSPTTATTRKRLFASSSPPAPPTRKKVVIEISDDDGEGGDDEEEEDDLPPPQQATRRLRGLVAPVPVRAPIARPPPPPPMAADPAAMKARLDALFDRIEARSSLATATAIAPAAASATGVATTTATLLPVPTKTRNGALVNLRRPAKSASAEARAATTTTTATATNTTAAAIGAALGPALNLAHARRTVNAPSTEPDFAPAPAPDTAEVVQGLQRATTRPNAWVRAHTTSRGLRAPLKSQLVPTSDSPARFAVGPSGAADAVVQVPSTPSPPPPQSGPPSSPPELPPFAWVDVTGRSIWRLHVAIRKVLEEGDEETVRRLVKELRHDWEVDEMAIFVEGYLRGALHERIH